MDSCALIDGALFIKAQNDLEILQLNMTAKIPQEAVISLFKHSRISSIRAINDK